MNRGAQRFRQLARLVDAGRVRAPIHRIYAFDDVAAAHEQSASERVRGKLVIGIESGDKLMSVGRSETSSSARGNDDRRGTNGKNCARL
jgi:hypothetical protein